MEDTDAGLEIKADPLEASFAEIGDEQVDALEGVRSELAVLRRQLAKITETAVRPVLASEGGEVKSDDPASRAYVDKYLRRGDLGGVEEKSMTSLSGPEGGYAVPQEIDMLIGRTLKDVSPIRQIASVVQTGTASYRKLVTTGGTPSGWVSETAARPETDTPEFNEIAPPSGELYANPAASQLMLDDAAFDVEAWLSDEIAREFAQAEGAAFVSGNGINRPRGFLSGPVTDEPDDVRAFGTLQYLPTGTAGGFAAADGEDILVDLVHGLRPAYRQGAAFVMNSATLARIRKFKTADGAFLWQASLASGQPGTLLGYPVIEAEDMPDVSADSFAVAFGNFRAGYLIAERNRTSILRDPFTNKPFVHFYATKRVGGQLMNSEAIKLLRFSAS